MRRQQRRWLLCIVLLLAIGLAGFIPAGEPIRMVMYDPGSPWQNTKGLQRELEDFLLLKVSGVRLKVYDDYQTLLMDVKNAPPQLILISGYYLSDIQQHLEMDPVLIATKGGVSVSMLVMVTQRNSESLTEFTGGYVAVKDFGFLTSNLLSAQFLVPNGLRDDDFQIIRTAKDVDTLFALYLNQIDLALVENSQLQYLRKVNPDITRRMRVIEFANIPNAVLSVVPAAPQHQGVSSLVKVIENMANSSEALLRHIGYDGWQRLEADDIIQLGLRK